jgi:hypothetical protein
MKFFKLITVALIALLGCTGLAQAQQGEIKAFIVNGSVQSKSLDGKLTPIARGDTVAIGTTIVTGADGSALLVFSNGAAMQVKPNSNVQVIKFDQAAFDASEGSFLRLSKDPSKSTTELNITKGTLSGQVKQLNLDAGSTFTVDTPAGSAGIRGTIPTFTVETDGAGKVISVTIGCAEGTVTFKAATIAGIPGALQGNTVNVSQGGQIKLSITQDPVTGQISSISVLGQAYTGSDAQAVIDGLYGAINQARQDQGLPPVTPPTAAPANPPNTNPTPQTTPTKPVTPPTNPTITE